MPVVSRSGTGRSLVARAARSIGFLCFLLGSRFALAQLGVFGPKPTDDVAIYRVDVGFDGVVQLEQWAPMTVWLTGGPKGFSGTMIVEYSQDSTQAARIYTPVAATPGVSTPAQITVCLPRGIEKLKVQIFNESGTLKAEQKLSTLPDPNETLLALNPASGDLLMGVVGPASAAKIFHRQSSSIGVPSSELYGLEQPSVLALRSVVVQPELLPTNWIAYSGLSTLVVTTEKVAVTDPRAIEAVRTWVQSGGRLVLLVDSPGDAWRRWLGDDARLIELDKTTRYGTPEQLARAIRNAGRGVEKTEKPTAAGRPDIAPEDDDQGAPQRKIIDRPADLDTSPARSVPGRALHVTAAGLAEGWSLRWIVAPTTPTESSGLIAEGPVGLGWITLMGTDPQLTTSTSVAPLAAAVWADAVRSATRGQISKRVNQNGRWTESGSAPDAASRAALTQILDSLSTVPPISFGIFLAILACLIIMAILVGPFDAIMLKRRGLRQWSWLTAILWISLASVTAYVIPSVLRSGDTLVNRMTLTDIVMDTPASPRRRGLAWTTGVTGIFAGQRGELRFRASDANPSDAAGVNDAGWWRGVAATAVYGRLTSHGFPPIETAQRGDLTGAMPGNVPESLWLGQWTFRTLKDDAPSRCNTGALLSGTEDGRWKLTLLNLPKESLVADARLVFSDGMHSISSSQGESVLSSSADGARWEGVLVRSNLVASDLDLDPISNPGLGAYGPGDSAIAEQLASLAGARSRTASIAQRVASGRWALLFVRLTGGPPQPDVGPIAKYNTQRMFRILIPLPPDQARPPRTIPRPPTPEFPRFAAVKRTDSSNFRPRPAPPDSSPADLYLDPDDEVENRVDDPGTGPDSAGDPSSPQPDQQPDQHPDGRPGQESNQPTATPQERTP